VGLFSRSGSCSRRDARSDHQDFHRRDVAVSGGPGGRSAQARASLASEAHHRSWVGRRPGLYRDCHASLHANRVLRLHSRDVRNERHQLPKGYFRCVVSFPPFKWFVKTVRVHMIAGLTQGKCSCVGLWGKALAAGSVKAMQLRALDWYHRRNKAKQKQQ
jgi:hypothetical protein